MNGLEEKIIGVLSDVVGIPVSSISMNSDINNTKGWDSLAMVQFIVALEKTFDIEIDIDDAEKFISIRAVYETLKNYKL